MSQETGMQSFPIPGTNYAYGATPVADLQSPEYTLAVTLFDESYSTQPWNKEMEAMVKEIVKFLRDSPRADNLLYAHLHFADGFREIHGYKPLIDCNEGDYDGVWGGGPATALYDSTIRSVESLRDYAKQHADQGLITNGILCVMTDGLDNSSSVGPDAVKTAISDLMRLEHLESMLTILIGINDDDPVRKALEYFAKEARFDQFVPVEDANAANFVKIASFISTSVIKTSQALGTGSASEPLTF